jgi:hypothetical protein
VFKNIGLKKKDDRFTLHENIPLVNIRPISCSNFFFEVELVITMHCGFPNPISNLATFIFPR